MLIALISNQGRCARISPTTLDKMSNKEKQDIVTQLKENEFIQRITPLIIPE